MLDSLSKEAGRLLKQITEQEKDEHAARLERADEQ